MYCVDDGLEETFSKDKTQADNIHFRRKVACKALFGKMHQFKYFQQKIQQSLKYLRQISIKIAN